MKTFKYESYSGEEEYLFVCCCRNDFEKAAACAEQLIAVNRVRVFFDVCDDSVNNDAETIAEAIFHCNGAMFFLSAKSCADLGFRNSINYAIGLQKSILCIKTEEFAVSHGLDMQLANVPILMYKDASAASTEIIESGIVTQQMIGQGMELRKREHRKTLQYLMLAAGIVIIFSVAAFFIIKGRVDYYNSPEYLLRDADGSEYIDISAYKEEGLEAMQGMSVGTLSLKDGDFHDLNAIAGISAAVVDVTGNPNVSTLWPLTQCKDLEAVKLSQDMLQFANDLVKAGITVIVTR